MVSGSDHAALGGRAMRPGCRAVRSPCGPCHQVHAAQASPYREQVPGLPAAPRKRLAIDQTPVLRDPHDQIEPDGPTGEQSVDVAFPVGDHGHGSSLAKTLAVPHSRRASAPIPSPRRDDYAVAATCRGRVQIAAPTTPITASSAASTAITGWMKNPGVLPLPAGPRPRRFLSRPAKLISLVSWIATTRRPPHCSAVRAAK